MDEETLNEKMEESYDGWKEVHDLEYMSIRDVYECAFRHGVEVAEAVAQGPVDVNVSPMTCPFCGSEASPPIRYERSWPREGKFYYSIECSVCSAEVTEDTREKAIATWNKRAN